MFEKITSSKPLSGSASQQETQDLTAKNAPWMQSGVVFSPARLLSANERTSINALIAYVASKSGQNVFRIERRVADRFNVPNILCLPAAEYDNAVRYLVDSI